MDMPAFTGSMTAWRPPAPPWAMSSPLCSSPSPAAPSPASTPWWAPVRRRSSLTKRQTPPHRIRRHADRVCAGVNFPLRRRIHLERLRSHRNQHATAVFATGISRMCATIPFLAGAENVIYSMLISGSIRLLPDIPGYGDPSGPLHVPGVLAGAGTDL